MTSQSTPKVTEILAGAGDMLRRRARRSHLSRLVRDDRAPPHVSVRHHARATGRRRGEESRQRREKSAGAHAQSHHHGAGAGRQADCRSVDCLRLLADQRRRGGRADRAARARAEFTDKPVQDSGHRADLGSRRARRERGHHDVPRGARAGAKGLQNGRRDGRRKSSSPKCTIVSPSPKSSRPRISDSSRKAKADPTSWKAARP